MILKKLHFNFIFSLLTLFLFGLTKYCFSAAKAETIFAADKITGRPSVLFLYQLEADKVIRDGENIIGKGAYGWVAQGTYAGHLIAIKGPFHERYMEGEKQLTNEIGWLAYLREEKVKYSVFLIGWFKNLRGHLRMVMPLYKCDLFKYVTEHKPLPLKDALSIAIQISLAIQELHIQRIAHRDIKPQNFLFNGECFLISDFSSAETVKGVIAYDGTGTPLYMAPECWLGKTFNPIESDIWALACTVGVTISEKGTEPYCELKSFSELKSAMQNGRVPVFDVRHESDEEIRVANAVVEVVMKCFALKPTERPSAGELVTALEGILNLESRDIDGLKKTTF